MLQQFHSKANTRASQSVTDSYQEHSRMSLYTLKEENFWLVKMLKKKKTWGKCFCYNVKKSGDTQDANRATTESALDSVWDYLPGTH